MALYTIYNGVMPPNNTTMFAAVATGTGIKTMFQVKPFNVCKIVEWGISFDGSAAATPVQCELLDTGTVFGTSATAHADADIMKVDGAEGAVASIAGLTLSTSATGWAPSAEGTITTTKLFDLQFVAPTNQYVKQFPLGREPKLIIGNAVRIRVKAGTTVNCICYMVLEF